jgi:AhpD family alkylhydroperoxidase
MSTVPMVEVEQATGLVKEVYDDMIATRKMSQIPNFWKTLATHPPTLASTWSEWKAVMGTPGRLDRLTKEMIAVAISTTNRSTYCVNAHTAAAIKAGMDKEMLGELMAVIGFFNKVNRMSDGYQVESDIFPKIE